MNQKREENGRSRGLLGAVIVLGALWIGWLSPWWAANRVAVGGFLETARLVVWWLALGWVLWIVPRKAWGWWSRRSRRAAGKRGGVGWDPGSRAVFAVVPVRGGGRRAGMGPGSRRRRAGGERAVEFGSCCCVMRAVWLLVRVGWSGFCG